MDRPLDPLSHSQPAEPRAAAAGAASTRDRVRELGTAGYLSCLAFSLALSMAVAGWRSAAACAAALLLAAAFYPAGLDVLRRKWLWILIAFMVIPAALLGDVTDWGASDTGFGPSWAGLANGLVMALRTIAIVVAVTGFTASVSVSELAGLMERVGFKGLGFALGVAMNMLPIVQETAATTFHALRLRGGFRRQRLQAVRLLLVTIVVNSLHHADDIVGAAEARAFSVTSTRPMSWKRRPADPLIAVGLLAIAGIVLLA